jgi:hypothetical protein
MVVVATTVVVDDDDNTVSRVGPTMPQQQHVPVSP